MACESLFVYCKKQIQKGFWLFKKKSTEKCDAFKLNPKKQNGGKNEKKHQRNRA